MMGGNCRSSPANTSRPPGFNTIAQRANSPIFIWEASSITRRSTAGNPAFETALKKLYTVPPTTTELSWGMLQVFSSRMVVRVSPLGVEQYFNL
jgi:hypothetical protein